MFAVFLNDRLRIKPAVSLLASLMFAVSITSLFSLVGRYGLFISTLLYFIFGVILFTLTAIKNKGISGYFCVAVKMVNLAAVLFWLIYAIRQPLFYYWDEYSFWGAAAKVTKELGALYTYTPHILTHLNSIPPTSSILSYILQFFSPEFYEYGLHFAYAFAALVVFGAVAEIVESHTEKRFLTPVIFLVLMMSVFLQTYHGASQNYSSQSYAYGTAMSDFTIAILALATLALYFSDRSRLFYLLGLAPLVLIKNVGIVFAVLVVGVIYSFEFFARCKSFSRVVIGLLLGIVLTVGTYYAWSMHGDATLQRNADSLQNGEAMLQRHELEYYQNPTDDNLDEPAIPQGSAPSAASSDSIIVTIVNSIFFEELRTARQVEVLNEIKTQFFTSITIAGVKDYLLLLGIIMLGILSTVLMPKKYRIAFIVANIGFIAGLYLYIHSISYFISGFGDGMVEYPRYTMPYYYTFIYFNFVVFIVTIIKRFFKASLALISVLVCYLIVNLLYIGADNTFIAAPENAYTPVLLEKTAIERYGEIDGRVLMIADRFEDYHYMTNMHIFFPTVVNYNDYTAGYDFSLGFSNEDMVEQDIIHHFNIATDEEFIVIFKENFDYLYISHPQGEFVNSYSTLFREEIKNNTLYILDEEGMFVEVTA